MAEGSLAELETQVIISTELGYCLADKVSNHVALIVEVRKMLNALRRSLVRKLDEGE